MALSANEIVLYGNPLSGHSYKVALMLAFCEIPHRYQYIDLLADHIDRPKDFQAVSKFSEVPVLVMDSEPYVQSNAILLTLADKMKMFGGESSGRLALCREWLFWESNRLGFSLPHLRFVKRFNDDDYNPGALEWLRTRYDRDIAKFTQVLEDGRKFLLDDELSIADISLFGYLIWVNEAEVPISRVISDWSARVKEQPDWALPEQLMPFR